MTLQSNTIKDTKRCATWEELKSLIDQVAPEFNKAQENLDQLKKKLSKPIIHEK